MGLHGPNKCLPEPVAIGLYVGTGGRVSVYAFALSSCCPMLYDLLPYAVCIGFVVGATAWARPYA